MVILEYVYNFFSRPGVKCVFIKSDKDLIFFFFLPKKKTAQRQRRELMTDAGGDGGGVFAGHSGVRRFVLTPPCSDGSRSLTLTLALWLVTLQNTHLSDLLIHTSL